MMVLLMAKGLIMILSVNTTILNNFYFRYFECQPKFGLFAPVAKVSKSPSNRKPGQCVVHKSGTSLRRANSKESMTSMTSNASSVRRVRLGVTSLTPNKVCML